MYSPPLPEKPVGPLNLYLIFIEVANVVSYTNFMINPPLWRFPQLEAEAGKADNFRDEEDHIDLILQHGSQLKGNNSP
ncbi:hypothetical protein L2E82_37447 [Cichorium intybus]|uniref:Uncharacterized protein n=1 Tax=Cichorium intybus TaxID=13427 RepID=A0ACB9AFJ9_CICIN|nr:hypothetical protein L2E82_37447 [Cichorium intybus]